MRKTLLIPILFMHLIFGPTPVYGAAVSLNILAPMRVLDPKLIQKFEKENNCQVRVEFMSDHGGYESHLRSEIQTFDVVIADEQSLGRLTTANLLRTLPEKLRQKNQGNHPLQMQTALNAEVHMYVPLFVNPMGIAYNPNFSSLPSNPTWNLLIESDKNPYWRQHVFITPEKNLQIALAMLAAHEPPINSKKLSSNTIQWLSKLRAQIALVNEPLELAFLGEHVNAAVLSYSDYLRYKNIFPKLNFIIPIDGTYFDRFGIGWCLSSTQEKLAQNFIAFMMTHSADFAKSNHLFDINDVSNKDLQNVTLWKLYDESAVLPYVPALTLDQ